MDVFATLKEQIKEKDGETPKREGRGEGEAQLDLLELSTELKSSRVKTRLGGLFSS